MDEDENRQFKLMFQKSEAVHHSKFIKSVLLNRTIKIIRIDPATTDFYIRLTNFYHQFQAIGNNYNQVVKAVKTNFGDKRGLRAAPQIGEGDRRTCDSEPPDSGSHQRVQGEVS